MPELSSFIKGLPKAELHLHVEGTLEPELRLALAARNKLDPPAGDVEELRKTYIFDDLTSFLAVYYDAMSVLRTPEDFYDLAWAYLERAAADNVRYTEIFFDPQAHTSRGVPFHTVVSGLTRALGEARSRLDVKAQLIMCMLRDFSAEYAMATLLEALPYRDSIVAVGLDSDERGNPPEKFADVFRRARAEGFHLTMHCDVDQENSTEHIRQCLDVIGVERIDHGSNITEDEQLMSQALERGIGFTACPISNRYVTGDLKAKQLRHMLDCGLKVTVNSDDPAYFAAYVTANLEAATEEANLTAEDLVALERNAFEIAWLQTGPKEALLAELDGYAALN